MSENLVATTEEMERVREAITHYETVLGRNTMRLRGGNPVHPCLPEMERVWKMTKKLRDRLGRPCPPFVRI